MEIGKEASAYADLLSIVAVERLVDDDLIVSNVTKKTFEDTKASIIVGRGECIISVNHFLDSVKLLQQLPVYC
jgi:hypothetical protein